MFGATAPSLASSAALICSGKTEKPTQKALQIAMLFAWVGDVVMLVETVSIST
ncbi:MAG: hypothetical protein V7459_15940 [Oceanicoccus sp.]